MYSRQNSDEFAQARRQMLNHDLLGRDITDPAVLQAMAEVPRHEFVPSEYHSQAYYDGPLPIGMDQTISQPYIVALMTQLLRVDRNCEVLEIGTGSGYQTAVLCRLAKRVYTIEKIPELSRSAQAVLARLSINNVEFYVGDGSCGWPAQRMADRPGDKTFHRIMITAAVPVMPEPLVNQLAEDGRIVAPVGGPSVQDLVVGEKKKGKLIEAQSCGCRFVRLIGKFAFQQ